jgi:Cdc48 subfamily AAA family protein
MERAASVLTRGELGLAHPGRPKGSFLFVGPTGVGKTELTNVFTAYLFGGRKPVRFDMSEYQNQSSVEKPIGERANETGLLGRALAGLTEGTLLFDEIEKAHPLAPGRRVGGGGESVKPAGVSPVENAGRGVELKAGGPAPPARCQTRRRSRHRGVAGCPRSNGLTRGERPFPGHRIERKHFTHSATEIGVGKPPKARQGRPLETGATTRRIPASQQPATRESQ